MDAFKKSFLMVLLCLSFVCCAAAWGDLTQEYVCEEAVEKSWGSSYVDKCFAQTAENRESLCTLLREVRGEDAYSLCMRRPYVHPALVPYMVFNDSALHYNYESCPLPKSDVQLRSWACNDSGRNLAGEQASFWLSSMNQSFGCQRIYRFCIGSNYFSDSFMPLYQLMYATPASVEEMDARVDKLIAEGKKPWGIDVSAAFQAKSKPRSVRRFEVSSRMFDDIIIRLAGLAGEQPEELVQPDDASCSDNIKNQGESGVDCGGPCKACVIQKAENCSDGMQNQDEIGVDCGGPCAACVEPDVGGGLVIPEYVTQAVMGAFLIGVIFLLLAAAAVVVVTIVRSRKRTPEAGSPTEGLDEALELPEPAQPPRMRPKTSAEVTDDTGLDEIGNRLDDIKSTLKRLE